MWRKQRRFQRRKKHLIGTNICSCGSSFSCTTAGCVPTSHQYNFLLWEPPFSPQTKPPFPQTLTTLQQLHQSSATRQPCSCSASTAPPRPPADTWLSAAALLLIRQCKKVLTLVFPDLIWIIKKEVFDYRDLKNSRYLFSKVSNSLTHTQQVSFCVKPWLKTVSECWERNYIKECVNEVYECLTAFRKVSMAFSV